MDAHLPSPICYNSGRFDVSLDVLRRVLLDQRDLPVLKLKIGQSPLELGEDSSSETLQVLARNDWRPAEVLRGVW